MQGLNVALAVGACVSLGVLAGWQPDFPRGAALIVYGFGLLAMVICSALYAWGRGGRRHLLFRHLDHAAIFVMIAGTYTPFTVSAFSQGHGVRLLVTVWFTALVGVFLNLVAPARFYALSVPLYLVMGWAVLSDPWVLLTLPASVNVLLVAGGLLYCVGVVFHLAQVRFQEAIWHGFVLAAAACHYAAVVRTVVGA